ncbi:MAG: DUF1552 domain-containing protein [Planctomycetota bacterium]
MEFSRRTLLHGFGTALSLPWLESLSASVNRGRDSEKPPIRLGFVYLPNGMNMAKWKPFGKGDGNFKTPEIFKPVENFKDKTTIISGLTLSGAMAHGDGPGDHARSVASFLTGAHPKKTKGANIRNGISVDQVAASQIGHLTRFRSLELGTESSAKAGRCDSGYSCAYTSNISWRTPNSPMAKEMNPAAVFQRLFGSADEFENKFAQQKRAARRKSILDFVRADSQQVKQKLSKHDQRKFEEYLFSVRDIEKRIAKIDKLEEPEFDISDFQRPLGVPASYGEHVKLMLDMMVLAFQTDSTRVISFMFANAGSNRSYTELGIQDGHHDISHHGNSFAKTKKIGEINVYHMSLFSHLLERLENIEEGNGTLLDNCIILYGSGISDGDRHDHRNLPIALFGGGGGTIDPGRHIRVYAGTPLTNLYCSLLDRVGAKVDSFSDSSGRIDQLNS